MTTKIEKKTSVHKINWKPHSQVKSYIFKWLFYMKIVQQYTVYQQTLMEMTSLIYDWHPRTKPRMVTWCNDRYFGKNCNSSDICGPSLATTWAAMWAAMSSEWMAKVI